MARAWANGPVATATDARLLRWSTKATPDRGLTFTKARHPTCCSSSDAARWRESGRRRSRRQASRAVTASAMFFPDGHDCVAAVLGARWLGATAVPVPWPATSLAADLPASAKLLLGACHAKVVCAPALQEGPGWTVLSAPSDLVRHAPPPSMATPRSLSSRRAAPVVPAEPSSVHVRPRSRRS